MESAGAERGATSGATESKIYSSGRPLHTQRYTEGMRIVLTIVTH